MVLFYAVREERRGGADKAFKARKPQPKKLT